MEMIDKIEKLLDEKVRPSLHAHGGDVVIKSYEDGCPSAHATNEELISAEVRDAFPEVEDVILVEEVSQDLIDMAYKILNHEV